MIINYADFAYPDPCDDSLCIYKEIIPLQPHYHYWERDMGDDLVQTAAIRGSVEVVQLEMWDARRQEIH